MMLDSITFTTQQFNILKQMQPYFVQVYGLIVGFLLHHLVF